MSLVPRDWDCSYEAHDETRKKLDLLISKHETNGQVMSSKLIRDQKQIGD